MLMQPVKVVEVENEGLVSLLGERVLIMCANYFYSGTLVGVNEKCVKLEDAAIVYETGSFSDKKWKDEQKLGSAAHYIMIHGIESFRKGK